MAPLLVPRSRVLVIDDDPILRELLCALFSAEDHTVEAVESGEASLTFLATGVSAGTIPTVILADMQLPGLSGAALAVELRRAAPQACLFAMSGSEPSAANRAAFDAFLLKPFSTGDFEAALLATRQTGSPSQAATPAAAITPSGPEPLDERTYAHLAAALPAAQLAELYQLTLDDIAARLASMRDALVAADTAALRREAHALKGGCSMVGAAELAALAARAEFSELTGTGSFGDTPTLEEFSAAAARLRSIIAARSTVHNESH